MQKELPEHGLENRDILAIAIPMIVSNATVPLVGIADTAVIGQLNNPALIGGVSLGSTLFALLFWAFGFLRMGTTGLTAQAVGAADAGEIAANLYRALIIAAAAGAVLYIFHVPASLIALRFSGGTAEVETAAASYFGVRILSAPATLANFALLGWFIGLAQANLAFWLQLFLNLVNIALAVLLVLGAGKGVEGAALAAVWAEYAALAVGLLIAWRLLRANAGRRVRVFQRQAFLRLLAVNGDIMIRTICLMFVITFFAVQGARMGDVALAANSVLRALSELSAYVLDGFAFAAEVLVGQAVGAGSLRRFRQAVALSSAWSFVLAACVSVVFWAAGLLFVNLMTTTPAVQAAAHEFLPWVILTPLAGFCCFQLDGIFIGTTRTADMRNMMVVSLVLFLAAWAILVPAFGNHGLWASLLIFYAARAVTLGLRYPALERAAFPPGAA